MRPIISGRWPVEPARDPSDGADRSVMSKLRVAIRKKFRHHQPAKQENDLMNELNATPSHQPSKSMNQTNTNRPLTPPAGPPTKPATPTPSQFSTSPPKAGLQTQSSEPKPAPKPEPKPAAKPEPKAEPKAQVQSKPAL